MIISKAIINMILIIGCLLVSRELHLKGKIHPSNLVLIGYGLGITNALIWSY